MNKLNRTESIVFLVGGAMMVFGVALNFFGIYRLAPWLFLVGAIGFAVVQIKQVSGKADDHEGCPTNGRPQGYATTTSNSSTLRRLRRMMIIADVLFVVAGLLFVENNWNFLMPVFGNFGMDGWVAYHQYVAHNNWIVVLLIAAILEMYSMHRISNELKKDTR